MIIRSLTRVQGPKVVKSIFRMPSRPIRTTRGYSTANPPSINPPTPQSHASMLATINTDLDKIAPKFEVQPEQIQILKTPAQFYETLKVSSLIFSQSYIYPINTFLFSRSICCISFLHEISLCFHLLQIGTSHYDLFLFSDPTICAPNPYHIFTV